MKNLEKYCRACYLYVQHRDDDVACDRHIADLLSSWRDMSREELEVAHKMTEEDILRNGQELCR